MTGGLLILLISLAIIIMSFIAEHRGQGNMFTRDPNLWSILNLIFALVWPIIMIIHIIVVYGNSIAKFWNTPL